VGGDLLRVGVLLTQKLEHLLVLARVVADPEEVVLNLHRLHGVGPTVLAVDLAKRHSVSDALGDGRRHAGGGGAGGAHHHRAKRGDGGEMREQLETM